jgi:hypothetical protein
MNNYFYDLPIELINKIYTLDNTYREIYNKVVSVINKFPVFDSVLDKEKPGYYVFLREYNFRDDTHTPLKEYLSVSKKYSFKKSIFIIIQKISKPNTLISNHTKRSQGYVTKIIQLVK